MQALVFFKRYNCHQCRENVSCFLAYQQPIMTINVYRRLRKKFLWAGRITKSHIVSRFVRAT